MIKAQIDISVIIPTHNRPEQLKRCLQGFYDLADDLFTYEIVVVDDGSTELLKPQLAHQFESLPICWLWQSNQGPASARNFGAKMAQGQFVAFIDDDCVPHKNWLATLWQSVKSYPSALIGGETVNGLPQNLYSEASQLLVCFLYQYFEGKNGRFFTSNNFALSRHLFIQLGGFDPAMPLAAGEDREFCARWLDAGLSLIYTKDAKINHFQELTLQTFWHQHVNYGRGAKQFRRLRQDKNRAPARLEPLSFYTNLLLCPLREKRPFLRQSIPLIFLMGISQCANVTGFILEKYDKFR